ncbi:NTF2-like protein [Amylostereum chailletii]|nr:NTF2-like protein [Amylostereum chailletii]
MAHRVFPNAVDAIGNAPLLVVLVADAQKGWCEQFAQEGYHVFQVIYPSSPTDLDKSLDIAEAHIQEHGKSWGLITYGLLEGDASHVSRLYRSALLKACIHYAPLTNESASLLVKNDEHTYIQTLIHLSSSQEELHAKLHSHIAQGFNTSSDPANRPPLDVYTYPKVSISPPFPFSTKPPVMIVAGETSHVDPYVRSATSLAYSRTLGLLRCQLGPHFELEKLWEKHTYYEFEERDAPKTMSTMVKVPYVNHVPTLTGGVGYQELARFYKYHFTGENVTPPDTELITQHVVGSDRIIDEMIFKATHTTEIDYFLPGIKPTGKPIEIALVGVVAFRGDKLTFEYWDQASVLVQLGLLDQSTLPVAGIEVARKVLDPFGVPSNDMMKRWKESEGLSIE